VCVYCTADLEEHTLTVQLEETSILL